MALTLEVFVADAPQPLVDGTYEVASDVEVKLEVAAGEGEAITDLTWELDGQPWPGGDGIVDAATSRTFKPAGKHGKPIIAKASVAGKPVQSGPIKLAKPAAESGGEGGTPGSGDTVTDVAVGVYDPVFAALGGVLLVVALVAFCWAGWQIASSDLPLSANLPIPSDPPATPGSGSFDPTSHQASRTASVIQVVAAFAGMLCLGVGAYLAALETRGRLRASEAPVSTSRSSTGELANLLEPLRRLRGTAIAFGVGMILILASLGFSDFASAPEATSSATPTPTAMPPASSPPASAPLPTALATTP